MNKSYLDSCNKSAIFYQLLRSDLLEDLHQDGNQACIDNFLDLAVLASSDVGHSPGRFFLDVGFVVAKQAGHHRQGTRIQHALGLLVRPGHDVTQRPQGWRLGGEGERVSYLDYSQLKKNNIDNGNDNDDDNLSHHYPHLMLQFGTPI